MKPPNNPILPSLKIETQFSPKQPFSIFRWGGKESLRNAYIHTGLEFGIITQGTGFLYLNGNQYPLKKGDAYFVDPLIPHGHGRIANSEMLHMIVVHLDRETLLSASPLDGDTRLYQPFLSLRKGIHPIISPAPAIEKILTESIKLSDKNEKDADLNLWINIQQALVHLYLALANKLKHNFTSRHQSSVTKALRLLDDHFREPIGVEQVAKHCSLSVSRLQHIFVSAVGMSIIDYRNRLRIGFAARCLLEGEEKLAKISEQAGFVSLAQFHTLFKRMVGKSPGSYKKSADGPLNLL